MNAKVINCWKKIVSANVNGWNKHQEFFVDGWNSVVRRFDWLPEMFSSTESAKGQNLNGGSDCDE